MVTKLTNMGDILVSMIIKKFMTHLVHKSLPIVQSLSNLAINHLNHNSIKLMIKTICNLSFIMVKKYMLCQEKNTCPRHYLRQLTVSDN